MSRDRRSSEWPPLSAYRHQGYTLRYANLKDMEKLSALEKKNFPAEAYGRDVLQPRQFRYFLTKANAFIFVCEKENLFCGYMIVLFRNNSDTARIYSIAISPSVQGKGIGVFFLSALEDIGRRMKIRKITLETRADNLGMQKLSLRSGYSEVKRLKAYYHDGADAFKYAKEIS